VPQTSSLLPVRHPNQDFFIADIFDALPVKNDRHTMEHPFFALSTKKDIRSVEYERDGIRIKLSPSAEFGLPTMMDKDILLYIGSLLMAEMNKGHLPPKTVRFSVHDLMVTTNRPTDGDSYKLMKNAFGRVTGCLITTDIKTNGIEQSEGFHILERYKVVKSSHDKKRMVRVEVTVSDWFYNALIGKEVLTINREYFRLRKPLERRLYELARKHCGRQPKWEIGLKNLKEKCGSKAVLDKFRYQIRDIIKTDLKEHHFPDYLMTLDAEDKVTFLNRLSSLKQPLLPGLEELPHIKGQTIERGREMVQQSGSGWDFYALHEQFSQSLIDGFRPKNVDGAFIAFLKKKMQERP
jgi:plasmid replication initiation protein